jgi:cyclase
MLTKRVIPCLDVKNGQVVKGVNFKNLQQVGDPVILAKQYYEDGADEITFLDVTASLEGRSAMLDVVRRAADQIFIPLTVGGGVRSVEDVNALLRAGADKVSVNTAALARNELIDEIAERFGSQVLVLSVDAKRAPDHTLAKPHYIVTTHGGKVETDVDALDWALEAERRGVGEVLLNSMDKDGTKSGFDIEMTNHLKKAVSLPVIASGGAGKLEDFAEALEKTNADALLAASVFHYGEVQVKDVKRLVAGTFAKI